MGDAEMKAKFLDAIKDPETAAALEAVLAPMVAAAVKAAMESKEEEIAVLREELKETRAKLDDLEQYSRKNCLNISGIPETVGESTAQLVPCTVGVTINQTDIDTCHRVVRQAAGKPPTIIVKFARFDQRQELHAARRQLREVAAPAGGRFTTQQLEKVFVSDNLTQHRQSVLYAARQLRRKGKLFAAWSDVGRLKLRVTRGGDTKLITSFDDLRDIVGGDPDLPCADSVAHPAAAAADSVAARVAPVPNVPIERPAVSKGKGKRGAR
ncbi:hypothetical protein FJT64_025619 [Amphibalanus amphitrite]|uniref:Uncharacterized protein n=1 Tax=Amphibalanus amphitrite TaxID=1232801 RepID=A0A6A4W2S8_AMPAM|nr:hypothetical protein FJT64_025619 [Amphibalanus amphitrite]